MIGHDFRTGVGADAAGEVPVLVGDRNAVQRSAVLSRVDFTIRLCAPDDRGFLKEADERVDVADVAR